MRAVGYVRVSSADQIEGYSLAAQERAIQEACAARGFSLQRVYRDEGISAHTDRLDRRPALVQLLDDASKGTFDVVLVHTLDRWARNLGVALQAINRLSAASVGLLSIVENIDYSTGQGRLNLHILGAFAEFFSDNLGNHVRKARRERYEAGMHNGHAPFGYAPCTCPDRGTKAHGVSCCGVVVVEAEAEALRHVAGQYASSLITLAQAAAELNSLGHSTRHNKRFTSASVRFLLSNPYLIGRVSHRDKESGRRVDREGRHPAILSAATFAQIAEKRTSRQRSSRPNERPYLLKGIVACVHCGDPLWSETHRSGRGLYREQRGTRQDHDCPASGRSVRCEIIDEQAAEVFGKLVLPSDWRAEIARRAENYERVRTVEQERAALNDRLRRLTSAYTMGNLGDEEYHRDQAEVKQQLARLRIPEMEEALAAGELLEDLGRLWRHAELRERHELLKGMVLRVYVDLLTGRLVGVTPKPAFWSLFESVQLASSRVLLLKPDEVRRRLAEQAAVGGAGGDGGESNSPSSGGPA